MRFIYIFSLVTTTLLALHGCNDLQCPEGTERITKRSLISKEQEYCVDPLGRKQGPELQWDAKGRKYEKQYKDGEHDGRWRSWWPNGQLHIEGIWDNELIQSSVFEKEGLWKVWHLNGQLERKQF